MSSTTRKLVLSKLLKSFPLILLYFSVLNEIDLNYLNFKYFSFNFTFILIYFWSLKSSETLGYGHIFFAGIINDVVIGYPIGVSAFTYLFICGFAAYLRNITLRPNLINDWLFFLFTILVVTAINFSILSFIFSIDLNYYDLTGNIIFTFLFYVIFALIFQNYQKIIFRGSND